MSFSYFFFFPSPFYDYQELGQNFVLGSSKSEKDEIVKSIYYYLCILNTNALLIFKTVVLQISESTFHKND